MMNLSSDPASAALPTAAAQKIYNQASEQDKQLRTALQTNGPFDSNVRALWNSIRENYELLILQHHEFSESNDVEQTLWRLHYRQIDDFRVRIRKSMAAAASAAAASTIPMPGAKAVPCKEPLHKLLAALKSFLSEATGFYHDLILKIRAKYGLPQDYSPFELAEEDETTPDDKRAVELKSCCISCHRCLIYLGDLARYKELHSEAGPHSYDWSVASGYYLRAASVWPSSGNPQNQLAVLATYAGDELLAVYRYFRSIAVEAPFLTARDNLILLFEKNRQHYSQLSHCSDDVAAAKDESKCSQEGKSDIMLPLGNGDFKLAVKDHKPNGCNPEDLAATVAQTRKSFRICFVRLNGILFTKTSLETFSEVYSATIRELEQLLSREDSKLESGLGSHHRSGIGTGSGGAAGVLQLVCALIFTVHNINWASDAHQPTYAEVLQKSALSQHAFTAAFEFAGRLIRRCADSKDPSTSPLLPAMLVFLEWLACRSEMVLGSEIDEKQANARAFFWRQAVTLLNIFCKEDVFDASLGGSSCSKEIGGSAIWEDYELRGFVPVAPAHVALDYSKHSPRVGSGDKHVRIQRLLAAGKAVACAFGGSGEGILYDEELNEFFMPGRSPQQRVKGKGKVNGTGSPVSLGPAYVSEEEEEVIVFKPMAKLSTGAEASISNPDGCRLPLSNSSLSEDKPVTKDQLSEQKNSSFNWPGGCSQPAVGMPDATVSKPLPEITGTGDWKGLPKGSTSPWRMHPNSCIFVNGPDKVCPMSGETAASNCLWSAKSGPLASGQAQMSKALEDAGCEVTRSMFTSGVPMLAPSVSYSETLPLASQLKMVKPSGASSMWSVKGDVNGGWAKAASIGPPPGFGPSAAMKTLINRAGDAKKTPEEGCDLNDVDEQPEVDDYRWLDDDTSVKQPATEGVVLNQTTSFLAGSPTIWTNNTGVSHAMAYPFPGMGLSHRYGLQLHEQQQRRYLLGSLSPAYGVIGQAPQQSGIQHLLGQQQQRIWYGHEPRDPFVS